MNAILWLVLCLNCGDVIITDHVPKGHRMECIECGEIVDVSVKVLRNSEEKRDEHEYARGGVQTPEREVEEDEGDL